MVDYHSCYFKDNTEWKLTCTLFQLICTTSDTADIVWFASHDSECVDKYVFSCPKKGSSIVDAYFHYNGLFYYFMLFHHLASFLVFKGRSKEKVYGSNQVDNTSIVSFIVEHVEHGEHVER